MEKVTRSLWAPAADGSGQETHWFYERARGQYADALATGTHPGHASGRSRRIHPLRQKFTKSDLAKFEHSWDTAPAHRQPRRGEELPRVHDQARGQAPGRRHHLLPAADRQGDPVPRHREDRHRAQGFGGYRANIVTYTIARLAHDTGQRIDLDRIWREQKLTPGSHNGHRRPESPGARTSSRSPVRVANVTEWAKHARMLEQGHSISHGTARISCAHELVDPSGTRGPRTPRGRTDFRDRDREARRRDRVHPGQLTGTPSLGGRKRPTT